MSYNGCKIKDYSRINPNTGTGFILSRLANSAHSFFMTRREVYEGTHYAKRFGPGYHSSIWAKLLEDGLIERVGCSPREGVFYFITERGLKVLKDMNARLDAIKKEKQEFCKHNGIQFGTGKKLPTVEEFDEKIGPVCLLTVTEKLDNVIRELQEIRVAL